MSKKTPVTEYANLAGHELFQLSFVCSQLANDLRCAENVLQARNQKWADLPPITNQSFNSAASRFLGILQLCRSVDIYNWYCREALKLALSANPKPVIAIIRKKTGMVAKVVAKADRKRTDAAAEIIREVLADRYKGDRIVREVIHRDLDVMQNPEVELLCACRNVMVHKRGCDEFGDIAAKIQKLGTERAMIGASSYPHGHMPIALNNENYLVINDAIGNWAADFLRQQIFMMDQNFAHVYKLPRKIWNNPGVSRKWLGNQNPNRPPPATQG